MADKKSMILYFDMIEQWDMLTDEQAGALIKALLRYGKTGEQFQTDDGMLKMAFSFIAAQIDRDCEKWDDVKKKRVEAAQKRWEKKQTDEMQCDAMQTNANDANASFALQDMQADANDAVNVTVNDTVNVTDTVTVINNNNADKPQKQKRSVFVRPTVEEVAAYCAERNNGIDAQAFIDFYASKGWMIGKNPMKDWKAAVRTWERNERPNKPAPVQPAKIKQENFQNDSFDDADIEALFSKNLFR